MEAVCRGFLVFFFWDVPVTRLQASSPVSQGDKRKMLGESFLAKFVPFMCVLYTDSDPRHSPSSPHPFTPSGPGRTAYNLHVTEDAYFPIYCVSEERGARCRGSSCCWLRCKRCSQGLLKVPYYCHYPILKKKSLKS